MMHYYVDKEMAIFRGDPRRYKLRSKAEVGVDPFKDTAFNSGNTLDRKALLKTLRRHRNAGHTWCAEVDGLIVSFSNHTMLVTKGDLWPGATINSLETVCKYLHHKGGASVSIYRSGPTVIFNDELITRRPMHGAGRPVEPKRYRDLIPRGPFSVVNLETEFVIKREGKLIGFNDSKSKEYHVSDETGKPKVICTPFPETILPEEFFLVMPYRDSVPVACRRYVKTGMILMGGGTVQIFMGDHLDPIIIGKVTS